ncbi:MAG: protein kinase, partial [Planctomycetes bacterium]|nr:protein kinase [Planctomycetota bacterium]
VGGGSVKTLIEKKPLSEDRAIEITMGVAEALNAAAKLNIIHRDIKPDNIMLTEEGEVKLADLGLAKDIANDASSTLSNTVLGTPAYISPEQADDTRNVDARADLYSLGASFYHMLTGDIPYEGQTALAVLKKLITMPTPDPRAKRKKISEATAAVCRKLMAKDRDLRYQSAEELLEDLRKIKYGGVTTAAPLLASGFENEESPESLNNGPMKSGRIRFQSMMSALARKVGESSARKAGNAQSWYMALTNKGKAAVAACVAAAVIILLFTFAGKNQVESGANDTPKIADISYSSLTPGKSEGEAGPELPSDSSVTAAVNAITATQTEPVASTKVNTDKTPTTETAPAIALPTETSKVSEKSSAPEQTLVAPIATKTVEKPKAVATQAKTEVEKVKPAMVEPQPVITADTTKSEFVKPAPVKPAPVKTAPQPQPVKHTKAVEWRSIAEANQLYEEAETKRKNLNPFKKVDSYKEAMVLYQKVIDNYPESDKVLISHYQLGNIYESIYFGEHEKAIKEYASVLKYDPKTELNVRWRIAVLYENRLLDRKNALKWYEIASKGEASETVRADAAEKAKYLRSLEQ